MTAKPCIHHWRVAAPNGPMAEAKCSKCSETREFPNVVERDWNDWCYVREQSVYVNNA
jgi:hypothetical protein